MLDKKKVKTLTNYLIKLNIIKNNYLYNIKISKNFQLVKDKNTINKFYSTFQLKKFKPAVEYIIIAKLNFKKRNKIKKNL